MAGRVTAAFGGDDTRPVAVPMFGGPKGTGGLTGSQLQTQYGINPASSRATGQTIATVQLSDWDPADLTTYKSGEGLTAPLNYTGVQDPSDPPVPDPLGSEEVDLDQETLYGAAPEAAQRAYMSGNDAGGLYDDITAIGDDASNPTHDFHITAASISWGLCEDTSAADAPLFDALEDALQYVLATGVTIFASSGDLGADCAANQTGVSYPASSPEVVAVGGTQFEPGATTLPATEEAWNDGNGHGSAGGASALFFQPSWQVKDGLSGQTMRTVPDISSLAGGPGYEVYTSSAAWQAFGGTSLASPTSAALLTDVLAEPQLHLGHWRHPPHAVFAHDVRAGGQSDCHRHHQRHDRQRDGHSWSGLRPGHRARHTHLGQSGAGARRRSPPERGLALDPHGRGVADRAHR